MNFFYFEQGRILRVKNSYLLGTLKPLSGDIFVTLVAHNRQKKHLNYLLNILLKSSGPVKSAFDN